MLLFAESRLQRMRSYVSLAYACFYDTAGPGCARAPHRHRLPATAGQVSGAQQSQGAPVRRGAQRPLLPNKPLYPASLLCFPAGAAFSLPTHPPPHHIWPPPPTPPSG
eukprot:SAG25_NODE_1288_length_3404_cov_3.277761_3_plen_108_part_00